MTHAIRIVAAFGASLATAACAASGGLAKMPTAGASPSLAVADPGGAGAATRAEDKMVITGSISLEVDDGPAATAAIRADVEAGGGRVVHDHESGRDHSWTARLQVRLPPGNVSGFVDRLGGVGRVVSRSIEASDVSRQYFDQEIALANLRITMERLQKLLGGADLKTVDVLEIERELTRVRGEIERIEGEHRYLQDRIAYATLDLYLSSRGTSMLAPQARLHPGVRGTVLYLVDAEDGQDKVRAGAGATLWFHRAWSFELDLYPATDASGRAIVATTGGGTYSDFLGDGRRRFLNPFLGLRLGYGWVGDRSNFVGAGEIGIELVKTERVVVEAAGRGVLLVHGDGADGAVQGTAGVRIPF
jgi:hypothetical protein